MHVSFIGTLVPSQVPAAVTGCMVAGLTSVPAAASSGGKYLKGIASILPALGQPVVARSLEATQTLACGPQPIPSPVNLTLSPGLPHLRYRTSSGCHPPQTLQ